jgi:hypothetical protein
MGKYEEFSAKFNNWLPSFWIISKGYIMFSMNVATLALSSWPRQGLVRVRTKRESRESHLMLLGVHENVREWTLTLPSELPLWDTYRWEALDKSYNFSLDLVSIRGLHMKLWLPKVTGVPTLGISGFPLESLWTKWHLGASPMARHKVHYKGEGGGFP